MTTIEPGWALVDMSALAADAGLSLMATRKLLKTKWLAGELDLQIIRETRHAATYYVRPPRARTVSSSGGHVRRGPDQPTDAELALHYPDVDTLSLGSFLGAADRTWYVRVLRRCRSLRLPMLEDISAA